MDVSCSPESLARARKKIERAAIVQFTPTINELNDLVEEIKRVLGRNGMKLDKGFKTYTGKDGLRNDLSDLSSRHHMRQYTFMSDDDKYVLSSLANNIQNKQNIIEDKISKSAFDRVMEMIENACNERKGWIERYGNAAALLVGRHKSKSSPLFFYQFSNKPEDIFKKSTGMSWYPHNCERYGGDSERGIYSDIQHNSIVVFLRKIKDKHVYARLMLRMCVIELHGASSKTWHPGQVSIGYDKYWYRGNDSHDRFTVNQSDRFVRDESLTSRGATREVLEIVKNAGFDLDYKACKTPFKHAGFSDVEQRKETSITYSSFYTECPSCHEIVPVNIYGQPRCNNCIQLYRCRNCGSRVRRRDFHADENLCNECYQEPEPEDDEEP